MRWYLELALAMAIVIYLVVVAIALEATGGADFDIQYGKEESVAGVTDSSSPCGPLLPRSASSSYVTTSVPSKSGTDSSDADHRCATATGTL